MPMTARRWHAAEGPLARRGLHQRLAPAYPVRRRAIRAVGSCERSEGGRKVSKKALVIAAAVVPMIAISAIAQQSPIKRTPLQNNEFPPGFNTVTAIVEVSPGNCAGRHTHPGLETSYVMDGAILLKVAGQPDRTLKAGESLSILANTPHDACTIPGETFKILAVYVVEKGKPLATPAP